jgi:hypothetical protein
MPLVIQGQKVSVPGLESSSFVDDPTLGLGREDQKPRTTPWVRNITLHTRMGIAPQRIMARGEDRRWDEAFGRRMRATDRRAGAHVAIDADGSFACHADLVKTEAFHAAHADDAAVGIEIYQDAEGRVWRASLRACVAIVDVITRELGIQRQIPEERGICMRFARDVRSDRLDYVPGGRSGRDFVGVFGHRNATRNRGPGDPGDEIFDMLAEAGYERFTVDAEDDLEAWQNRQRQLPEYRGAIDGIPGPRTLAALEAAGHPFGLWIRRPEPRAAVKSEDGRC